MLVFSPPNGDDTAALQRRLAELDAERENLRERLSRAGAVASEHAAHRAAEVQALRTEVTAAHTDTVQARREATDANAGHARNLEASQAELATSEAANTALRDANAALEASRAALHRSEARLQMVVESATEYAIVTTDPGGVITGWNSGAEQVLGWTEVKAVGRSAELFFTPEDRVAGVLAEEMRTALAQGRAADERWHVRHSGERFWANGTMMPLRDPGGKAVGYLKILRDQTRQHEAGQALHRSEAALAASEAQFRATFEQSAVSIAHVGLDGRWLRVNARLCAVLGYTETELLDGTFQTITHPDDVAADLEHARELLAGEVATYTLEKRYLRREGTVLWSSLTVSLARDTAGAPQYFIAVAQDITERKRTEAALAESEAKLRQARKLEAIGRLAAGVAHDFNNILQGVSGGLELVLDEVEAGSPAHEFAELALGSARRGSTLTHYLLSYARKQMLLPKLVELAPFLSDVHQVLTRTLGPHITVKVRASRALLPVQVDPGQLETALLNLAINASHAMPKGGTLTLEAREGGETDRQRVVIAVTDTGTGMDEATLVQACEPFFTTKGLDGTGLGLSMVQGFAEQSGGEVRIVSAPSQGTTVELWLPAAGSPSAPEGSESSPVVLRGTGRVLLVDDVSDVLVTARAFLERAGFQVIQAGSGDQALAVLAAGERFDILVTDYAMPGLNGVDLIEQARAVQLGLPALLITGFAEVGGTDALPEAVAVLRKPFHRQQLVEAVLHALGPDTAQAGSDTESRHGRDAVAWILPVAPWAGPT